ncbi:hypothetical protein JHK82_024470 [Glycine max]|nr:hypothetical protein JHK85_025065 [Glycine max]KAG5133282.1 hypothetical protein JHK82_024470 [Glycine max]
MGQQVTPTPPNMQGSEHMPERDREQKDHYLSSQQPTLEETGLNTRHRVVEEKFLRQKAQLLLDEAATWCQEPQMWWLVSLLWRTI